MVQKRVRVWNLWIVDKYEEEKEEEEVKEEIKPKVFVQRGEDIGDKEISDKVNKL